MLKAKKNWLRKYKKSSFHLNDWVIFSCLFNNVNKIWMLYIRTYMKRTKEIWKFMDHEWCKKNAIFRSASAYKREISFSISQLFFNIISPSFPFEWSVKESNFFYIIIIIICTNLMDKSRMKKYRAKKFVLFHGACHSSFKY